MSKAWRKAQYEELWLQFRPRGSKDVFEAVEAAVQVANQAVDDAGWDDVFTAGVSDSDAGPAALMSRAGPEEGVRAWFTAFAQHLEALGKSGRVTAAPEAFFPEWLSGGQVPQQLTAFVSYETKDLALLDDDEQRRAWHVPKALTAQIAGAATSWGRFEGADVYLSRRIHQTRTRNPNVGQALAAGAIKFAMARVAYLRSEPRRFTWASMSPLGRACYGVLDDTISWQDRLARVIRAMTAFPADTDLAFVQYSAAPSSWSELSYVTPTLPHVEEYHVRYNRHLNGQYIPDAHGVQLLTDAHLEHANDLSDWNVTDLGGGKHLVEAKDLRLWYANIDPDPETLAQARADFGGMILTKQIIADNPPPWS